MNTTKTEEHLSLLDLLRGIAIMAVFINHALIAGYGISDNWNGWLRNFHQSPSLWILFPATLGWGGVAIFFVVSGFCIHLSRERSKEKQFRLFFARRLFRIYPPYFLALILFALFFPLTRLGFHSLQDFAQLGSHLLLIHNFSGVSLYAINGPFWTIAVEVQLYLLYPFLVYLVQRLGWNGALWLTGTIEITIRAIRGWHYTTGQTVPVWFSLSPFAFWFSWSIGAALADCFLKAQPILFRKYPLLLWPLVTVLCNVIKPLSYFCFVTIALSTASFIAYNLSKPNGADSKVGFLNAYVLKHVVWTGGISYSVYLLFNPLLGLIPKLFETLFPGRNIHAVLIFAVCLLGWPFVLLLSYIYYQWVERPSINLGKWFIRTKLVGNPR